MATPPDRLLASGRDPLVKFAFPHSHAFNGGRALVDDGDASGPECLVEFGDGVTVIAEFAAEEGGFTLRVPPYRTARGIDVAARRWRIVRGAGGDWRSRRAAQ
jgi:hypothetical protein